MPEEFFDYTLPRDRIAQRPARRRDGSRLLIVDRRDRCWRDARFPDIIDVLTRGDLLIINDTRVFPARLFARRSSGAGVELLLTRPVDGSEGAGATWRALVRPARKGRAGDRWWLLEADGRPSRDAAVRFIGPGETPGERVVALETPGEPWAWILAHGHVPLPPYIDRQDDTADRDRYQTVYAAQRGAVAAPTAGLHFTESILRELAARGVDRASLTLHVGPGTFRPITADRVEDHVMDREWFELPSATADAIGAARARGGRVVAVGTTTVRALESAPTDSGGVPVAGQQWTDLFIRPGHDFQFVDALLTNFHLPRSTLLLLVAAFAGDELIGDAYRHAIEADYRFYSYGDAMLIV